MSDELTVNMDMTTVCVALKKQPVLVTRRVAHQLAKRGLSVGRTSNKEKERYVHLLTAISAAGVRVCTVAIFYDRDFTEEPRMILVCEQVIKMFSPNSSMSAKGFGCGLASLAMSLSRS